MSPLHRLAVRHPGLTVVLCLAALGGAWVWVWPPTFNSSAWVLMRSDQRNLSTYTELRQSLGGVELIGVVIDDVDVFSDAGAARIERITEAVRGIDGMAAVTSLTTNDRPVRRGMSLAMIPFIPEDGASPAQWRAIEDRVTSNIIARNVLVSPDGDAAMVLAINKRDLTSRAAREALRADVLETIEPFQGVSVVAYSVIDGEVRETARRDAVRFIPVAMAVTAAVLLVTFRRPALVGAMLANQLIVLLTLPVFLKGYAALAAAALGRDEPAGFDLYTGMLLPLTAAIHLALQVHVVAACLVAPGAGPAERIDRGVRRVTRPTVIAAATTVVGLLSLAMSDIDPVVRFALVGAAAVAFAAAYTLGPGVALIAMAFPGGSTAGDPTAAGSPHAPAWLRDAGAGDERGDEPGGPGGAPADAEPRQAARPKRVGSARWGGAVAIVLLGLVPGVAMIRTDVRAIEFLNEQSMTRRAAEVIDDKFGGANLFMIECSVEPGAYPDAPVAPINAPQLLRFLAEKRRAIAETPGVGDAYDYSQAFSMMNRIWHGDDPAHERIPQSGLALALVARLLDGVYLPFMEKLRSPDGRIAFIIVRTASMPSRDYLALLENVMQTVERGVPEGVNVRPRTGLHSILDQNRKLVADQSQSAALTVGAAFLIVASFWRSLGLALAVAAASTLPVLAMLGLAGYTDTSINSITMMTAAVVLGLAVDDCAHVLHAATRLRREGRAWPDAVAEALRTKRRPIICTSAILASMLGLFALSSFPPVRAFGLLACAALAAALAAVLLLLPWLVRLPRRHNRQPPQP